jgi:hypothetical protein
MNVTEDDSNLPQKLLYNRQRQGFDNGRGSGAMSEKDMRMNSNAHKSPMAKDNAFLERLYR